MRQSSYANPIFCGNFTCEPVLYGETCTSCKIDCCNFVCPDEDPEISCADGQDNDCDDLLDCNDGDCSGDPACGSDTTDPTVSTYNPADNATDVAINANLIITFSENVDAEAGANNDIVIKRGSDDSVVETIDAQSGQVTGGGTSTITINPSSDLLNSTAYYIQIGADAFDDAAGNSFAGISDNTTWNFTTVAAAPPPSTDCDNDGTDDGASETCNNCPYDVRCAADEKCLAGDTCSSASWECKREVICGDGWVNGEECDDGGICTALPLQTTMYEGMNCKDIDPSGNLLAGVARCRATGGICVAQDGDGCSWDCQDECKPDGSPCVGGSECCGSSACVDGVCGPELCEDDGDTCCVGTCDASGAGDGSCTGGKSCCKTGCSTPEICDNDIDDDGDSKIDCADEDCPDGSVCDTDRWCLELSCNPTITGTCSLTPCPGSCSVTADKWSFTVGGITDASPGCSGGGDCSQFVGSFSIEYRGGFSPGPTMCSTECEWCWENDLGGCEGGAAVWNIGYNEPSGKWRLYADTAAVYEAATWNCLGDNTFNRISFDSDLCAGWPDTIEVTPADKWRECGN